jgi:hypothetical protein
MILLKNPSLFVPFLWPLADEEEFVASVNFPLHHFPWFDINGGGQREGEVDIALRDAFFAADGLDFG